jgi:hypothetical protein
MNRQEEIMRFVKMGKNVLELANIRHNMSGLNINEINEGYNKLYKIALDDLLTEFQLLKKSPSPKVETTTLEEPIKQESAKRVVIKAKK